MDNSDKVKMFLFKLLVVVVVVGIFILISLGTKGIIDITTKTPDDNRNTVEIKKDNLKDIYMSNVFDNTVIADEKVDKCEELLNKFISYCNAKEYDLAYSLVSQSYKDRYNDSKDKLQSFIDVYFQNQKDFSYQNLSNIENNGKYYIFKINLYDDIMLYGMNKYENTNQTNSEFIIYDDGTNLTLTFDGYIYSETEDTSVENEYVRLAVLTKDVYYDKTVFSINVDNLTNDKIFTFYDKDVEYLLYNKNIGKYIEANKISITSSDYPNIVYPNNNTEVTLIYEKYVGSTFIKDFRINIAALYCYSNKSVMEVSNNVENVKDFVEDTYTNVYIVLKNSKN